MPGRSRALQIAERFGLDPVVVADARSALGEERVTLEATISALETARRGQGLTLAHFSPQPELFLTQNTPPTSPNASYYPLHTLYTPPKQTLNATPIQQTVPTLS